MLEGRKIIMSLLNEICKENRIVTKEDFDKIPMKESAYLRATQNGDSYYSRDWALLEDTIKSVFVNKDVKEYGEHKLDIIREKFFNDKENFATVKISDAIGIDLGGWSNKPDLKFYPRGKMRDLSDSLFGKGKNFCISIKVTDARIFDKNGFREYFSQKSNPVSLVIENPATITFRFFDNDTYAFSKKYTVNSNEELEKFLEKHMKIMQSKSLSQQFFVEESKSGIFMEPQLGGVIKKDAVEKEYGKENSTKKDMVQKKNKEENIDIKFSFQGKTNMLGKKQKGKGKQKGKEEEMELL